MYGLSPSRGGTFVNIIDPDEPVRLGCCSYWFYFSLLIRVAFIKSLTVLTRKTSQCTAHANDGSTGLDISRNVVSFNPWTVVKEIQLKCGSCMNRREMRAHAMSS